MADNKKVKKAVKKLAKSKYFGVLILIVIIMIVAFALYCYFNPEMYNAIRNLLGDSEPIKPKQNVIKYYTSPYVVDSDDDLDDLTIHMVDVGQGDSFIIELPDGANVLIDAGKSSESDQVLTYAQNLGITVFDVVIITHSDEDHIGGIDEIFENFEVKNCYRPYVYYGGDAYEIDPEINEGASSKTHNTNAYGKVLESISNETYKEGNQTYYCTWEYFNKSSSFGRDIVVGDKTYNYNFDFLTPTSNLENIEYKDLNDFSPYVLFTYGLKGEPEGDSRFDMLFTGDAEKVALNELLLEYDGKNYDVDVLKVGHHGSKTSTTRDFLNFITPEYAMISCGLDNSYKHPHQQILDLFIEDSITFYRTDLHGDVYITINENGNYDFHYEKSPSNSEINVGGNPSNN